MSLHSSLTLADWPCYSCSTYPVLLWQDAPQTEERWQWEGQQQGRRPPWRA
jgi:hypothetical protein